MAKKEDYIKANIQYLKDASHEEGVVQLGGGVMARVLKEGSGAMPNAGSVVTVYYTGRLINGKQFDGNRDSAVPDAFRLRDLIDGWQIALTRMRVGDRWEIIVPADKGYGKRGDADIPGNSTLIFDIELMGVA